VTVVAAWTLVPVLRRCARVQVRKKREFVKIRKDELKQDEGAAASAQARASSPLLPVNRGHRTQCPGK